MHVDGFRFDLASILGRDRNGRVLADPPLVERIAEDPILRDAKMIAEAWDAAGAYQVGSFSHRRGRNGTAATATTCAGSGAAMQECWALSPAELPGAPISSQSRQGAGVQHQLRHLARWLHAERSRELQRKHNEANGEDNRDGADKNHSANYGVEGETDDPAVEAIRQRQIKNFLLTLADLRACRCSRPATNSAARSGATTTPTARTTRRAGSTGRSAIAMTKFFDLPALCSHFVGTTLRCVGKPLHGEDIQWFDPCGRTPDWSDTRARSLACLIRDADGSSLYLMFNADRAPLGFVLPVPHRPGLWRVAVDTAQPSPEDAHVTGEEGIVPNQTGYGVAPRSGVILLAR